MHEDFPPFRPPLWLRNAHAQTIAALAFAAPRMLAAPQRHRVDLPDGDAIVLSDDCPQAWRPGDRTALLVHGLAGCHQSPYMRRIAAKLTRRGVRAFRLDLRGCGAGEGLARLPYHAGMTSDLRAALVTIAQLCPQSPTALVGFSLGGNLVLKLLGEANDAPLPGVDRGIAVCPPIDLELCCRALGRGVGRWYDRHFVSLLMRQVAKRSGFDGQNGRWRNARVPRTLFEFDDWYTAPVSGFTSAEHYYRESSAAAYIPKIMLPTIVLASGDDPVVPACSYESTSWPSAVRRVETSRGGHLGFINRRGDDPDRCWMDWRVVDWVSN